MTKENNSYPLGSRCKSIFSSKIFIAILFTLIGAAGTVLAKGDNKKAPQQAESFPTWPDRFDKEFASMNHDPFFNDYGMFEHMREINKHMDSIFESHRRHISAVFDQAKKSNNATKTSVSRKQDDDNYYYELKFSGFDKEDIVVEVKDAMLSFSAKKEQEMNNKGKKSGSSSSFYYSFSIPKEVEKVKPDVLKEDGKVVVTFSRKS